MRNLILAALLLAACGAPTSSAPGDASSPHGDGGGTAGQGEVVQSPSQCRPGLIACRNRTVPQNPATEAGNPLICVRADTDFHCGACFTLCPSMVCSRSDAGAYACAP